MSNQANDPVTHLMAEFAQALAWDALPAGVRTEAVRAWTNWVACALGGSATSAMDAAAQGMLAMDSRGAVRVLGRGQRFGVADAALLGALASTSQTYDDTHLATTTHPTGPIASALLSVADKLSQEGQPVSGASMLGALIAGMELECRMSCAILANGGSRGWFITGLSGGVGAAAAVGMVLGLTREQMVDAIGLAATHAGGMRATHGSMAMTYVPGMAARAGVASAYFAQAGFTCSAISIDGRNGLLQVLGNGSDTTAITQGLGDRFEMMNNTYKPYPCGIVIHPALDACLHLVGAHGLSHADIAHIDMRVNPNTLALTWRKLPVNVFEAQVSLFHWVAAAFVHGAIGIAQGEPDCVWDPRVRDLQERASAMADDAVADNQAHVSVTTRSGKTFSYFVENAIGSVTNPLSDAMIDAKFLGLAEPLIGAHAGARSLAACRSVAASSDVAEILDFGSGAGVGGAH